MFGAGLLTPPKRLTEGLLLTFQYGWWNQVEMKEVST